jgi:hypothetical protein
VGPARPASGPMPRTRTTLPLAQPIVRCSERPVRRRGCSSPSPVYILLGIQECGSTLMRPRCNFLLHLEFMTADQTSRAPSAGHLSPRARAPAHLECRDEALHGGGSGPAGGLAMSPPGALATRDELSPRSPGRHSARNRSAQGPSRLLVNAAEVRQPLLDMLQQRAFRRCRSRSLAGILAPYGAPSEREFGISHVLSGSGLVISGDGEDDVRPCLVVAPPGTSRDASVGRGVDRARRHCSPGGKSWGSFE